MPVYDARCKECNHEYEFRGPSYHAPGSCPDCGADDTTIIWKSVPSIDRAKDPYDYLTGKGSKPDGKKIVSGPSYSSKTTT